MPFRMLRYMMRVWDRDRRERGGGGGVLPVVIPMVLYHGDRAWGAATRFEELVVWPGGRAWPWFRQLIPHFGMLLVDLSRLPDEQIGGASLPGLVRLLFKHAGRMAMLALLVRLRPVWRELFAAPAPDLRSLRQVVDHVFEVGREVEPPALVDFFVEAAGPEARAMAMTAYQIAVEEGRMEGKAEGKAEGRAEGAEFARRRLIESGLRLRDGAVDPQRVEDLLQLDDDALVVALSDLAR